MLDINMEFHKGVLFVRLNGVLEEKTVENLKTEVTSFIKENGIRNIVFNVDGLKSIDCCGINALLYNYEICRDNKGKTVLCGMNNSLVRYRIENSRLLKYMYEVSDELSAINVINL